METIRPQETIIYGGAFNPPTLAHQAILQACIDYAEPRTADVWLLPSASRQDKTIDVLRERRLELCHALVEDCLRRTVKIDINPLELDRNAPTETYDTVCELEETYPDRTFTWVFGSDSIATMRQWGHGWWLQDHLDMLVIERPGYPLADLGARVVQLMVSTSDLSSTELRRRMAAGEEYDDLVGPAVGALLAS